MPNLEDRVRRLEELLRAVVDHLGGVVLAVDGEYFVAFNEHKKRQEVA